jgi:hypothetical protein
MERVVLGNQLEANMGKEALSFTIHALIISACLAVCVAIVAVLGHWIWLAAHHKVAVIGVSAAIVIAGVAMESAATSKTRKRTPFSRWS